MKKKSLDLLRLNRLYFPGHLQRKSGLATVVRMRKHICYVWES